MPRYFFHFFDGTRWFSDGLGHELSSLRAARVHALGEVQVLKAALRERQADDFSGWIMTVVDASGRAVFALDFHLRPRLVPMEFLAGSRPEALAATLIRLG